MFKRINDQHIIKGIRNNDPILVDYLYRKFFPWVSSYVLRNSGSYQDAEDIYQDALIEICLKVNDENFKLTSSFKTFLFAICINLWRVQLYKMKKKAVEYNDSILADENPADSYESEIRNIEKHKLFLKHFRRLSEECQKILSLHSKKMGFDEIQKRLNYPTIGAARKKKFDCKAKLLKMINKDPEYKQLISEDNDE